MENNAISLTLKEYLTVLDIISTLTKTDNIKKQYDKFIKIIKYPDVYETMIYQLYGKEDADKFKCKPDNIESLRLNINRILLYANQTESTFNNTGQIISIIIGMIIISLKSYLEKDQN